MNKIVVRIILAVILVILAWVAFTALNNSISNALNPLKQANLSLSTQIADLLHPTPTILPDPITIIHEVRGLARLETIQYSVEKIITAEIGGGTFEFLNKDRLLLVAHGTVIAGVDLEKLTPDDLWLTNSVLNVRLPAAEIFIATLDNEKSYIFERETSILRQSDPNLETLARKSAEQEIRKSAVEDGILELAQQNAESYLSRLFLALGYEDVIFMEPALSE
ncbi:MAG: hypothetical protein CVU42_08565 [Chloroflexi bacterium HGW-Chloroflexi-4]|jgi:hypothetical protein|nr:MAG: hypothetical protein CVU42_08565 [Chloroflexi bacterium HGW-Chloroflexi-4]